MEASHVLNHPRMIISVASICSSEESWTLKYLRSCGDSSILSSRSHGLYRMPQTSISEDDISSCCHYASVCVFHMVNPAIVHDDPSLDHLIEN